MMNAFQFASSNSSVSKDQQSVTFKKINMPCHDERLKPTKTHFKPLDDIIVCLRPRVNSVKPKQVFRLYLVAFQFASRAWSFQITAFNKI